uniref:Uncharacterized protein n=1 Tax=Timema genevievae TaxID=629358 RepID=A0A7R9PJA0_TIMGE|nr:unnamed protein product [Timema genevievae]
MGFAFKTSAFIGCRELPEPPKDCVLRNRSESEGLEVACIPGFDGDLPQHFLLEVSESPSITEFQPQIPHGATSTMNDEGIRPRITGPPIYIELGAKPVFVLHSLEAGKDYELAVFARNDWGKSDPPVIIPKVRVTTAMEKLTGQVSEEAESGASTQPMAVVLGVMVAAAFLILGGIFVTAGLVICKRRSLASQGATASSSQPQQFLLDELLRESPPKTCGGGMYHDELMNVMVHVPTHVARVPRVDVVMPRMRFRNENSEKESQPVTRTSIVEDEGGGGGSVTFNHRRAHNDKRIAGTRQLVVEMPKLTETRLGFELQAPDILTHPPRLSFSGTIPDLFRLLSPAVTGNIARSVIQEASAHRLMGRVFAKR